MVAVLAVIAMVALTGGDAADESDLRAGDPAAPQAVLIRGKPAMSNAEAVVLGLVEGITEYLPISSTGHLLVAQRMMDLDTEAELAGHRSALDTYTVAIQIGAILAVLGVFRRRVASLFAGWSGVPRRGAASWSRSSLRSSRRRPSR